MEKTNISETGGAVLWIALLTAASAATTWVLACSTPFAALAALAAVHMRRQDAVLLVIVAWLASQVVGFAVLDYPHDARTIAWGFGIGFAAVASALGALFVRARPGGGTIVTMIAAFWAAFVAYNAGLALVALGLGGIETTLDLTNLARQFARNGAILVALYGLYRALLAIGMPAPARQAATA